MSENLASSTEHVVTSMEQMVKSIDGVARNAGRITDEAASAVTASVELDRSIRSVVGMTRQAREITTRVTRDAEAEARRFSGRSRD